MLGVVMVIFLPSRLVGMWPKDRIFMVLTGNPTAIRQSFEIRLVSRHDLMVIFPRPRKAAVQHLSAGVAYEQIKHP